MSLEIHDGSQRAGGQASATSSFGEEVVGGLRLGRAGMVPAPRVELRLPFPEQVHDQPIGDPDRREADRCRDIGAHQLLESLVRGQIQTRQLATVDGLHLGLETAPEFVPDRQSLHHFFHVFGSPSNETDAHDGADDCTAYGPRVTDAAGEGARDLGNDIALDAEFLAHGQQYRFRSTVALLHDLGCPVGLDPFLCLFEYLRDLVWLHRFQSFLCWPSLYRDGQCGPTSRALCHGYDNLSPRVTLRQVADGVRCFVEGTGSVDDRTHPARFDVLLEQLEILTVC